MKIGLAYRDDERAPFRPINAEIVRETRPDFLALEVSSVPELRDRLENVARLRTRAAYVIPLERLSGIVARLMVRTIVDEGVRECERIILGADPSARMTPATYVSAVMRLIFEAGTFPRLSLGVGRLEGDRGLEWLRGVVGLVKSGTIARERSRGVDLAYYPAGGPSRRRLARLVEAAKEALPAAELHLWTGWRTGTRLEGLDRLRAEWSLWRLTLRAAGRPTLPPWPFPARLYPALRDDWILDAWQYWRELEGSTLTVVGHVENAGQTSEAWNVTGPAAGSAWRRLRLTTSVGVGVAWPRA